MSFLSNWIFWIIVAFIVFLLSAVGYLSESRKKNKEVVEEQNDFVDNSSMVSGDSSQTTDNSSVEVVNETAGLNDEWNVMPEVNSVSASSDIYSATLNSQSETQVQSLSGVESAIDTTSQSVNTVNQGEETISSAPITYTVNQANDLNNQTVSAEPMVNQVVEPVTSDIVNQANDLSNQTITPGVYDPSSIFMASVDQKIPEPVTIPAQPTPVVNPTQMPGADSQVSPAIQSSELGGTDNL